MKQVQLRIPAEDLTRQYREIAPEVRQAIDHVLPTGKYTLGPAVQAFEREWRRHVPGGAADCRAAPDPPGWGPLSGMPERESLRAAGA